VEIKKNLVYRGKDLKYLQNTKGRSAGQVASTEGQSHDLRTGQGQK